MRCEWCNEDHCVCCLCTVCGVGVAPGSARVLQCATCRSLMHATCAPSEDVPVSQTFYCSMPCRLGVTVNRNPAFNAVLSARLELKCDRLWQAMAATDVVAYYHLRHRMWAEYFEREKQQLPMFPRCRDVADDVRLPLLELLSPEGQAGLLCTLHPLDHPLGSAVAMPARRVWRVQRVQPGSNSDYVAEAAEVLCTTRRGSTTPRRDTDVSCTGSRRGAS
ncbi:hypothetical protein TraAM80_03485 [Trypanosoma rangeli]|uniref:Uncharacterized protein n=1 Tax=Trypanosoma rangeli TaxID=5698 RepID=A0A422NNT1_TRYRA|nr:uncharacterized protein TraAM80_03485 [Trypanosoma rangeli]RNF07133.1 hypothetical protein TraAM80_03485 [Trypanosoma rangeli]|eukprot:RNF07133.1 hypothetical protein TraAM80_03485 [Trypanosoma rangeli]